MSHVIADEPTVPPRLKTRFAPLTEFFVLTSDEREGDAVVSAFLQAAQAAELDLISFSHAWREWKTGNECPFVFGHTVFVELDVLAESAEIESQINELMELSQQGALLQFVPFWRDSSKIIDYSPETRPQGQIWDIQASDFHDWKDIRYQLSNLSNGLPWNPCSPAYVIATDSRTTEIKRAGELIGMEFHTLDADSIDNAYGSLILVELDQLSDPDSVRLAETVLMRRLEKRHQYSLFPFWSSDAGTLKEACPEGVAFEKRCFDAKIPAIEPFDCWEQPQHRITGILDSARVGLRRQGLKPLVSALVSFVETPVRFASLVAAVHAGNLLLIHDLFFGIWFWLLLVVYSWRFVRPHLSFLWSSFFEASAAGRRVFLLHLGGMLGLFPLTVVLCRWMLDVEWRIAIAVATLLCSGQWLLRYVSRPRDTSDMGLSWATVVSLTSIGYGTYVVSANMPLGVAVTCCCLSTCLYFAMCHVAEELNRYVLGQMFFSRSRQHSYVESYVPENGKSQTEIGTSDDLGMLCREDETPEEYYERITRSRREQGWTPPANDAHGGHVFISHRNDGGPGQEASELLFRELRGLAEVVPFLDYLGVGENVRWRHDIGEALSQTGIFVCVLTSSDRDYWVERELECALWMKEIYGTPEVTVLEVDRDLSSLQITPRLADALCAVPRIRASAGNVADVIHQQLVPYIQHRLATRAMPTRLAGFGPKLETAATLMYGLLMAVFPVSLFYLPWRVTFGAPSATLGYFEAASLVILTAVSGLVRIPQVLDWLSGAGKRSVYTEKFPNRHRRGLRFIVGLWAVLIWGWVAAIALVYLRSDHDAWSVAGLLSCGLMINCFSGHFLKSPWAIRFKDWQELPEEIVVQTMANETNGVERAISNAKASIWKRLSNWIWGYDFFISYHWKSGGQYAVSLAEHLRDQGFDCFLDRAEFAMGDDWKEEADCALKNTQRLIVVATRDAVTVSEPVANEVEIFSGRRNHIIPIVFVDPYPDGEPFGDGPELTEAERTQSRTLALFPDEKLYLADDATNREVGPSREVVKRIASADGILRRRRLRVRLVVTSALILSCATVVAVIFGLFANTQRHIAEQRADVSEARRLSAHVDEIRESFPQRANLVANLASKYAMRADRYLPDVHQALVDSLIDLHGTPVATSKFPQFATASMDGRWMAVLALNLEDESSSRLEFWNKHESRPIELHRVVKSLRLNYQVAFDLSLDGSHILIGGTTRTPDGFRYCKLEVSHGTVKLNTLLQVDEAVNYAFLSPDGRAVVSVDRSAGVLRHPIDGSPATVLLNSETEEFTVLLVNRRAHWAVLSNVGLETSWISDSMPDSMPKGVLDLAPESKLRLPASTVEKTQYSHEIANIFMSDDARCFLVEDAPSDDGYRIHFARVGGNGKLSVRSLVGHTSQFAGCVFGPANDWFATIAQGLGSDERVLLWDSAGDSGSPTHAYRGHEGPITCIQNSKEGVLHTTSLDGSIRKWHVPRRATSSLAIDVGTHRDQVKFLSTTEKWLVSSGRDRFVCVSNVDSNETCKGRSVRLPIRCDRDDVFSSVEPTGRHIVTVGDYVQIWPLAAIINNFVSEPHEPFGKIDTQQTASSADRSTYVFLQGQRVAIVRFTAAQPISTTIKLPQDRNISELMALSPNGHWLAVADTEGKVWMADTRDISHLPRLVGNLPDSEAIEWAQIHSLTCTNDGQSVFGLSRLGEIWCCNGDGQPRRLKESPQGWGRMMDVSPDGRSLLALTDQSIRYWDLHTLNFKETPAYQHSKRALSVSPDRKWFANGTWDIGAIETDVVQLWRLSETGSIEGPVELPGHGDYVSGTCFLPDGSRLAVATDSGLIRVWTVAPKSLRVLGKKLTGRQLFKEELSDLRLLSRPD